ncbi:neuronal acetylcholine receptor subunit alpha-3 [Plakobranchus ocellatus]|uniref:Neuronal acetylcholine receptor subunit alpha-3 n=1 Tax=Plakobranchus ocellatus TaxID=259542 RepID=A0AAV3Y5E3_9GAST|nr:neuronal acetylcholine receptor subunit alpha-3 [Plakobranchus ocellatus]
MVLIPDVETMAVVMIDDENTHHEDDALATGALASGGSADMSRLLDKIFQGYNPAVLPRINNSRPVEVQVGMGIIAVVELDTKTQVLNLRAYVRVNFGDYYQTERLSFDSIGIKMVLIPDVETMAVVMIDDENTHHEDDALATGALASGGSADMSRLLDKIFQGYNPAVLPRINNSRPVEVQVGMGIIAVVELDTKTQVLNLRAYVRVMWTDYILHWDPSDYGNITYVILSQNTVWKPDITLISSLKENIYVGGEEVLLRLNYNGVVSWQPAFNSDFTCEVDVSKYPMDVNTCIIKIGAWMHDRSCVTMNTLDRPTVLEPNIKNGQFNIEAVTPEVSVEEYDGELYEYVYFGIKLHRRPAYTFLSLLLPMFVIGLLNIASFMIPADHEGKVDLSLNILLSTTVFIGVCHDDLPDRSDKISAIAVYVISLFVLSFLGVLGNTIVLLVHQREESKQTSDACSSASASSSNKARHLPCEEETDPFLSGRVFTYKHRKNAIAQAEMSPEIRFKLPDQSDATFAAHAIAVLSGSKAARLNFLFLIVSALVLTACSVAILVQIMT